jgi:hypothetical protein
MALAPRTSRGDAGSVLNYDDQPMFVRFLVGFGGVCMFIGPLFRWTIMYDFAGRPHVERGLDSPVGWAVMVLGAFTLWLAVVPRLMPLAIASALIGGALSGLELISALPFVFIPDMSTQVILALIGTVGGAAVAGAGGITATAIALAVHAARGTRSAPRPPA